MEFDLFEISGDDEPLLPLIISSEEVSETTRTRTGVFACSPIHVPRSDPVSTHAPLSPIDGVMSSKIAVKPDPSLHRDSVNKENQNATETRVELPKLNVEPQKMKRKKKGAGFNLRKSLAWDRAFLTEEGVLDSVELSIITGSSFQSGGGMLPLIQEEQRESLSGLDCSSDSPGLRALEEKLFKSLPVDKKKKEKKVIGGQFVKSGSPAKPAASLASRKTLSAEDARSGSKRSGCPRPSASSSFKRPANANITKSQYKETKVSKTPVPASDPPKLSNTARKPILGPSKLKQNQPAQPTANVRRTFEVAGSSNKAITPQISAKSRVASKPSIPKPSLKQARRNVVQTGRNLSENRSKFNSQQSLVTKSKDKTAVTSDFAPPGPAQASIHIDACSSKTAALVSQSPCKSTLSTAPSIPQTSKPSGLRMPSPSIGFFDQAKITSPHGSLQKGSQCHSIPRSDISHMGSLSPCVSTPQRSKFSKMVHEVVDPMATDGNTGILGSDAGLFTPSKGFFSSKEKMKPYIDGALKVAALPCISSNFQISSNMPQLIHDAAHGRSLNCPASSKTEKIHADNHIILESGGNKVLFHAEKHEEEKEHNSLRMMDTSIKDRDHCRVKLEFSGCEFDENHPKATCPLDISDRTNDQPTEQKVFYPFADNNGVTSGIQTADGHSSGESDDDILKSAYLDDHSREQHEKMESWILTEGYHIQDYTEGELKISKKDSKSEGNKHLRGSPDSKKASVETSLGLAAQEIPLVAPLPPQESNSLSINTLENQDLADAKDLILNDEQKLKLPDFCSTPDLTLQQECLPFQSYADGLSTIGGCPLNDTWGFKSAATEITDENELDQSATFSLTQTKLQSSCQLFGHDYEEEITSVPVMGDSEVALDSQAKSSLMNSGEREANNRGSDSKIDVSHDVQQSKVFYGRESGHNLTGQLFHEAQLNDDSEIKVMSGPITAEIEDDTEAQGDCSLSSAVFTVTEHETRQVEENKLYFFKVERTPDMEDPCSKPSHGSLTQQRLTSEESEKFDISEYACPVPVDCPEQEVDLQTKQTIVTEVTEHRSPKRNAVFESLDCCSSLNRTSSWAVSSSKECLNQNFKKECSLLANNQGFKSNNSEPSSVSNLPERFQETAGLPSPSTMIEENCTVEIVPNIHTISPWMIPAAENEDIEVSEAAKYRMGNAGSAETKASAEKVEHEHMDMVLRHDSPVLDTSVIKLDRISDNTSKSEEFEPAKKDSRSSLVNNSLRLSMQKIGGDLTERTKDSVLETSGVYSSGDKNATTISNAESDKKPEALAIIPPADAVPFSDEWLAAIEAAGEEILTLKTGSVQHSPPDKTLPDPNPWSPVKRKNNQGIGPFDCTKHTTNLMPPDCH